ncbi:hypothetical protein [Capnocytophaga canimorsus]|nr:hypothetical protein [Capnocytophaga canimorsus]
MAQKKAQRLISDTRSKLRWIAKRFVVGQTRLKGLEKVHTQHILEAVATI